ncbi:hypothetical protein [Amycolatopsis sp. NPDC098790]|uniref:hypothetical protein n=1 Tax=Amycolatopsis sp. NPDC098790 TaxID=3363939 RepID=UPI0037F98FCD
MPTLTELPCWTIRTSGDEVTFTHVAAPRERQVHDAPRVWGGRGLALHEHDVEAFAKALGEVMKLPAYWRARAGRGAPGESVWSEPRHDPDDGFVYINGPCRSVGDHAGYRPTGEFTFDLAAVRELRVRFAAYLHDQWS